LLTEEALLWRSSKHLGSQTEILLIDQGKALIRGVVLTDREKSDKAKIEVYNFIALILTSCIMTSTMLDRLDIDRP